MKGREKLKENNMKSDDNLWWQSG